MAKKTRLFVQFVVSEESSQAIIWTSRARRKVKLEAPIDFVEVAAGFTDRYSIYVAKGSARLDRDTMINMTEALRQLGHSIAF